ncbi:MAG: acyltransferase [Ruminococcaceae bacterium]|nr:acyltransferase [Oscillospiraceae bacterium]
MFKKILRNLLLKEKASPEKYADYLRAQGVELGRNVRFYSPSNTFVDISAPWLITIGDNSKITHGVIILTHDYSWAVLKKLPNKEGRVLGAQSPVIIGKNVFIGMNAIITRGVTIGDNVVIGAGSVVTRDCEPNSVYAGNPAKRIMSIDEFYEKRVSKQFDEAKKLAVHYKNKFKKNPPKEVFSEYFMLFCSKEEAMNTPTFMAQMKTNDNLDKTINYMENNRPLFESFEDFLKACFEE